MRKPSSKPNTIAALAFFVGVSSASSVQAAGQSTRFENLSFLFKEGRYAEIQTACRPTRNDGCRIMLSVLHRTGPLQYRDMKKGRSLLLEIGKGSEYFGVARYFYARDLLLGSYGEPNLALAREQMLLASARGVPEAAGTAGWMLRLGKGGPIDYEEAEWQYRIALDHDEPEAYFGLGQLYFQGWGVPQDRSQAIDFWKKAADRKVPAAIFNLGVAYYEGLGVDKDNSEAFRYFSAAMESKFAAAFKNLGLLYVHGDGVEQDIRKGCQLIKEGGEVGDPEAEVLIGKLTAQGICVSN